MPPAPWSFYQDAWPVAPSFLDPADGDAGLETASVAEDRFPSRLEVLDDHAPEARGHLRMAHEIPEADPRARFRHSHDLLDQLVDTVSVQPFADVRDRERIDSRIFAAPQIFCVTPVDQVETIEPGAKNLALRAMEIRWDAVGHPARICAE